MTQHQDLFAALAAPFERDEVKVRSYSGRQLHYITARTVMNRLDNVLGPENWWDEYIPSENSVLCRLSIRLPDGSTLTKADAADTRGWPTRATTTRAGSRTPSSGRRCAVGKCPGEPPSTRCLIPVEGGGAVFRARQILRGA